MVCGRADSNLFASQQVEIDIFGPAWLSSLAFMKRKFCVIAPFLFIAVSVNADPMLTYENI
jgi:hypothetical protein